MFNKRLLLEQGVPFVNAAEFIKLMAHEDACFQAPPKQSQVHNIYNVFPSSLFVGPPPTILFSNVGDMT